MKTNIAHTKKLTRFSLLGLVLIAMNCFTAKADNGPRTSSQLAIQQLQSILPSGEFRGGIGVNNPTTSCHVRIFHTAPDGTPQISIAILVGNDSTPRATFLLSNSSEKANVETSGNSLEHELVTRVGAEEKTWSERSGNALIESFLGFVTNTNGSGLRSIQVATRVTWNGRATTYPSVSCVNLMPLRR